ncbi:MAG TPA: TIGR03435 family protein, partial [Acidobacteriaceae bacterium]|nr:TIGR03435 family protein [Acidobacteriaceae bacterium]
TARVSWSVMRTHILKSWPLIITETVTIVVLVMAPYAHTQSTPLLEFEVASVKPQVFGGQQGRVGVFVHGNTLDAEHVSLTDLVKFAYNLRDIQLSGGPSWAQSGALNSSELYQVIAKTSGETAPDTFRQMLQTLLTDRFKLRIHHLQRDLPVYNLVVNKGGPKLRVSSADGNSALRVSSSGRLGVRIVATHTSVQQLIDRQLGKYTDRPIFDKTGLTAACDFTLEFAVERGSPGLEAGPNEPPALVTAIQDQLGLRLEPGKAPFDTVVIDHAERPSQN